MSRLPPLPPVKGARWVREEYWVEGEHWVEWHLVSDVSVPCSSGVGRTVTLGRIWREPDGTWEGVANGLGVWGRNGFDAAVWVARCARKVLRLAKEAKP